MALLVEQRTCDLQVVGLSPDWVPLHSGLGQATQSHLCASVTKQYNLVLAKVVISLVGIEKVYMENNCSLQLGL